MKLHSQLPDWASDGSAIQAAIDAGNKRKASQDAEERTRIGNTPTCEDCGKPEGNCACDADAIDWTQTSELIDITPVGCQTPEGIKRVNQAQNEWDSATHELANYLKRVVDEIFDRETNKIARAEYYSELQTLIGIREVKQNAWLKALTGR